MSLTWTCSVQAWWGDIYSWGWDQYNQARVPYVSTFISIACGYADNKALQADGTVLEWGENSTVPSYVTNVTMIASGDSHALGLRSDGTVTAWGDDSEGQCNVPAGLSNVVAVAGGGYHSLALKNDGTVVAWGYGAYGQTAVPPGLSNVVQIAGGEYYSLAVTADGSITGWGGVPGPVPQGMTNVVSVAAGFYHCLALLADGTVVAWGDGETNSGTWPDYGQAMVPAGLSGVVAVSAGGYRSLALTADGNVAAWGENDESPSVPEPSVSNATAISTGGHHDLALVIGGGGPPFFTVTPVSRTVVAGSTVYVRAAATGQFPLNYQWQFAGINASGANNPILALTNIQPAQAGAYSVTISNSYGSISNTLSISVLPFFITGQPQSQTVAGGATVVLSVTVVSQAPLSYQWSCNGTNLPGQVAASLTLTNVQLNQAGTYSVLVSNFYGATVSTAASLSVVPFFITLQPQSQSVYSGTNVTFAGAAQGQAPFAYQWLFDDTNLADATGASLTLTNVQPGNSGSYTLQISNAFGVLLTSNATLAVVSSPPILLTQPVSRSVFLGTNVTFTVSATGSLPLTYQWRLNGTNIAGATGTSLALSNVQAAETGLYDVVVANPAGTTNSATATLSLIPLLCWGNNNYGQTNIPSSLGQVVAVAAGNDHNLVLRASGTVAAWGAGMFVSSMPYLGQSIVPAAATNVSAIAAGGFFSLALRTNGTLLAWGDNSYGQTNIPAGLTNVVAISAGGFHALAITTNATVRAWGRNLEGQTNVPSGLSNVIAVAAGAFHSVALKSDGTVLAWGNKTYGQTNVPAGLGNVVAIAAGPFHSVALRGNGTVVAWGAAQATNYLPAGLSNVVAVAAGGAIVTAPSLVSSYTLALRSDGSVVGRGNPDQYGEALEPAGANDTVQISAGGYHSLALLGNGLPWVERQPATQTVYSGANVALSVAIVSPSAVSYQWQFDGTNIVAATNAVLDLTNLPLTAQGIYAVVISNAFGTVTSANADLTVLRSTPQLDPLVQVGALGARLQISGLSGHGPIILSASTDLITWLPILTNPPVVGTLQCLDPSAANLRARFYRVVEQ